MASNLTIESLDFNAIRDGDTRATGNAIEFLWLALNQEGQQRRRNLRLAQARAEWETQVESPSAALDDFAIGDVGTLRFDGATSVNVTGLLAPSAGRARVLILLVLGSGTITLKHNSASSEEPNRILTFSTGDLAIATNKAVMVQYQDSRWRELRWAT